MSNTVIYVPSAEQLRCAVFQRRLWIIVRNLHTSRRQLLEQIVCAFRDYRGSICMLCGQPYAIPQDFDAVFGDDPHCRWFSYYLEVDPSTGGPKRRTRAVQRLELLALYCQIRFPWATRRLFGEPSDDGPFD